MTLGERLNPFHVRHARISAPCDVTECVARLRADVAPYWTWGGSRYGMRGTLKPTHFELQRRVDGSLALLVEARGRLAPGGRGTLVDVTLGWGRYEVFSHLWEVGAVAFLLRENLTGWRPPLGLIAVLVILMMLPTLLSISAHVLRAHDDDWLVARLCELLGGSEVPVALD